MYLDKLINFLKKSFSDFLEWLQRDWIILLIFIFVLCTFQYWGECLLCHFSLENNEDNLKFLLRGCGYIFGGILLMRQVYISHLRVQASEKTAEAQLKNNVETRYNNTLEHLSGEARPLARLGSIYQLYYIANSNPEYRQVVLDLLIEHLHILCKKYAPKGDNRRIIEKEKQVIVDKLFKDGKPQDVFGENHTIDLDLENVVLSGLDLTGAWLVGANIKGSNIENTIFKKANLSKAKLPTNLNGCKDMSGAKLNEVELWTSTNLKSLNLKGAEIKNSKIIHADLTGTDLTGANLAGTDLTGTDLTGTNLAKSDLTETIGLTFEQLRTVESLYKAKGLETDIRARLEEKCPHLFTKPTD